MQTIDFQVAWAEDHLLSVPTLYVRSALLIFKLDGHKSFRYKAWPCLVASSWVWFNWFKKNRKKEKMHHSQFGLGPSLLLARASIFPLPFVSITLTCFFPFPFLTVLTKPPSAIFYLWSLLLHHRRTHLRGIACLEFYRVPTRNGYYLGCYPLHSSISGSSISSIQIPCCRFLFSPS